MTVRPITKQSPLDTIKSQLSSWVASILKDPSYIVLPIIVLSSCLLVWQIFSVSQGTNGLPGPLRVFTDTKHLIFNPWYIKSANDKGLGWHIVTSLGRVAIGYGLAATFGTVIGILIGTNVMLFRGFDPLFQVLRTVAPLAWLPISQLVFGKAEPSAIFLIFITSIWPIIINTSVGVQQVPQDYKNVARVLQLPRMEYFWRILLPAAAPYIFTGLRIAVGLSWLAIVAAEMITGGVGIGSYIWDSYNAGNISEVILCMVYVGVVGLILDKIVFYVGKFTVQSES
jgi:nitrate/nitrite transport system permease protein